MENAILLGRVCSLAGSHRRVGTDHAVFEFPLVLAKVDDFRLLGSVLLGKCAVLDFQGSQVTLGNPATAGE